MKYIHQIFILGFLLIISCTTEKQSEIYEFAIDANRSVRDLPLSQICNEIEYIPITTDSTLIGRITGKKYANGEYAISSDGKVFFINKDGVTTDILDKKGNGPGEYPSLWAWDLSTDENKVVYGFSAKDRILFYDKDGSVSKEIRTSETIGDLWYLNDTAILSYTSPITGTNEISLRIINNDGKVVWTEKNKFRFSEPEVIRSYVSESQTYRIGENLYFKEMMDDTLFYFDKELNYSPYAIFNTGDLNYSTEKRENTSMDGRLDVILVIDIFESKEYFIVHCVYNSLWYWLADKNTGESVKFSGEGFINDMDGGLPFKPEYQIDDDYLIQIVDAYKFNAWLEDESFKKFDSDPEAKEKFRKLAESLSENDNPVIIKCKLK